MKEGHYFVTGATGQTNQYASQEHDQEGLWARGRSLRMTFYKGMAKHSSSQSQALMCFFNQQFHLKLYMEKCPFIMLTKCTGF